MMSKGIVERMDKSLLLRVGECWTCFLVLQPLKLGGGELRTNGLFATGGFLYSRQVRWKAIKKLSLSKSPKERGRSGFFT